jgi:hypothetical protein
LSDWCTFVPLGSITTLLESVQNASQLRDGVERGEKAGKLREEIAVVEGEENNEEKGRLNEVRKKNAVSMWKMNAKGRMTACRSRAGRVWLWAQRGYG